MNNEEVRDWLDLEWEDALGEGITDPDPDVDALANSSVVSIRYALVNQLLGKIADPSRSLMVLQHGEGGAGDWDARSFSTAVVVPWVADNQNVLGTSAEPYASKPLRRTRLSAEMPNVRSKGQWRLLAEFFEGLEDAGLSDLQSDFRRVLRSLARRLAQQQFSYPIPQRISLSHLEAIISSFLTVPSGGLRPLAVASALFTTLGEGLSLFTEVKSQGVNEADAASGMPGDIMCYDGSQICLVVEVKDIDLTLAHVRSSSRKAKQSGEGLSNLLFAVPGVWEHDRDDIDALADRDWASGLNIYSVNIQTLSSTVFALLDERWRVRFLKEVGLELDQRQNQPARRHWHDLLIQERT